MLFRSLFLVFFVAFASAQTPVNVTDLGFKGSYPFTTNTTASQLFVVSYNNETFGINYLNAYAEADSGLNETTYSAIVLSVSSSISQSTAAPAAADWISVSLPSNGTAAVVCQNYSSAYASTATGYAFVNVAFTAQAGDAQDFDIEVQIDLFDSCNVDNFGGSDIWIWIIVIVAIVLVILVIIAAVAGFLYWKKKQSGNYALYNDS